MNDIENHYGLSARLSPNNRRFEPSLMCLAKGFWWALVVFLISKSVFWQIAGYYYEQEIFPYMECFVDLKFPVPIALVAELNTTGGISCSTTNRAVPEACACCFGGECYRQITIPFLGNATGQRVNLIDEISGVFYERSLPASIKFCFLGLDGKEECKTETGGRMGYILRVIEIFHGWPIGGKIVDDPEKVPKGGGWFWFPLL